MNIFFVLKVVCKFLAWLMLLLFLILLVLLFVKSFVHTLDTLMMRNIAVRSLLLLTMKGQW